MGEIRIKRLLAAMGINQGELAEILGVDQASISGWIRGRTKPRDISIIEKLDELFKQHGITDSVPEKTNAPTNREIPRDIIIMAQSIKEDLIKQILWSKDKELNKEILNILDAYANALIQNICNRYDIQNPTNYKAVI